MVKRRSTIEPAIGHMQSDGRPGRRPACGDVRRRPQHLPDPEEAAASLPPNRPRRNACGWQRMGRQLLSKCLRLA